MLLRDARSSTEIIYPWQLPDIMRKHIVTGAMGTIYFVLLGLYLVPFGTSIGMQYWHWGVLSAACSFVLVLEVFSAYMVARTGIRRSLWFLTALAGRLLRGLGIAAAFLFMRASGNLSLGLFLLLLVAAACFEAIADPPWFSWLADIIPHGEHGRFWGRRSAWIALAGLLVTVPIGYAVDHVTEDLKLTAFMMVFGFGFTLGILDLIIHRTIPEPRMKMPPRRAFWHEMKAPFLDPGFRPWLIFNAVWTFSMTLGGSLAMVYFVDDLKIRGNFTGGSLVLVVVPQVVTVLTAPLFGRMVDSAGTKRTMLWSYAIWALWPLFWVPATPETALFWLGLGAVVGSVGVTGGLNAGLKFVTRQPPAGHVATYVAVSTSTASVAGGFGPLVAGFALQALKGRSWQIAGLTVIGFHLLFVASFLLRSLSILGIRRIPEPHQTGPAPSDQQAPSPAPSA
jgi:MFS family permease